MRQAHHAKAEGAMRSSRQDVELRRFGPYGVAVGVVLLIALPFILISWLGQPFELTFIVGLLLFSILALSLDLIWGYGGIISLAQGTFFGFGGYAMGYALVHMGGWQGAAVGLLFGTVVAAIVGMVLGLISFRARVGGLYFAIITLALALIAEFAATSFSDITGGDNGIGGIPSLAFIGTRGDLLQYYVILAATLVAFFGAWVFVNSHFGRVLTSARENELRATTIGFDINLAKAITFSVSSALAAAAGALFATYNGFVNPDMVGFTTGANVLIWVAIGGRGYLMGALIGTFLLNYAQFKLTDVVALFAGEKALEIWPFFFGIVFLLVILIFPNGLAGALAKLGSLRVSVPSRVNLPGLRARPRELAAEPATDNSRKR